MKALNPLHQALKEYIILPDKVLEVFLFLKAAARMDLKARELFPNGMVP